MKKTSASLLSIALVLSILLTACASSTVVATSEKFMQNIIKGDYEEAKELCTDTAGESLPMLMMGLAFMGASEADIKCSDFKAVEVNGDEAKVSFKMTYKINEEEKSQENSLKLIKKDGKWLVKDFQ